MEIITTNLNKYFFYFETDKIDAQNFQSYYFNNPIKVISFHNPKDMKEFFVLIEKLSKQYYLAGFFSYELGYLFEKSFVSEKKSLFPYALFGVFEKPAIYNHKKEKFITGGMSTASGMGGMSAYYQIKNLRYNIKKEEYFKNINSIKKLIVSGDTYQINYSMKCKFNFSGSPFCLYSDLKKKQRVSYSVFASVGDYSILSFSPELFFDKKGEVIKMKPMKGTVKRGFNSERDNINKKFLENDTKNRSENIMIVDLLRNDLSKISASGTVKTANLFNVEKYNTLYQMTSSIESRLKKNLTIYEIIKNIFPSGSITGAPKISSMKIIKNLEKEERKIYTGALGFFCPDNSAKFNVAIRTILINGNVAGSGHCGALRKTTHKRRFLAEQIAEMGVGGGIVYDSTKKDEFAECKLKAQFLRGCK